MAPRSSVILYLNGERLEIGPDHAQMMLADYLRRTRNLTGTKIVCAEGDCGACSVLRYFPQAGQKFLPINSCITTVAQMDGSSLVTVDSLSHPQNGHTPVQKAMIGCHGSQCGFCTPGFVIALTGLVEAKLVRRDLEPITPSEAKNALTGNLCRCTGYQPILDAATSLDLAKCKSIKERFLPKAHEANLKKVFKEPLLIANDSYSFYAPKSLSDAARYLAKNKNARILGAGTDLGVQHNKRKTRLIHVLSLHLLSDLYEVKSLSTNRMSVGARVTLADLREAVAVSIPELARFLDIFASPQIKNTATLVGNLGNASPIGDLLPFLLISEALVHVVGPKGKRQIPIQKFFVGYRKTSLKASEIIASVSFDVPKPSEHLALYKVSERKDLDISSVNAAYRIRSLKGVPSGIDSVQIAMGGVAATPVRFPKTEILFKLSSLSSDLLSRAEKIMQSEIKPMSDLRGSSAFRRVLTSNLFKRAFREWSGSP